MVLLFYLMQKNYTFITYTYAYNKLAHIRISRLISHRDYLYKLYMSLPEINFFGFNL